MFKGRDHNVPLPFGPYLAIAGAIALFFGPALVKLYLPTDVTLVVGLTGGIGSGKSAVADAFAALGVDVTDTDRLAHALTAPGAAGPRALRRGLRRRTVSAPTARSTAARCARASSPTPARARGSRRSCIR